MRPSIYIMDKKYIVKMILLNAAWIVWIALSVVFGYLIAATYFPENIVTFIPFSLIFLLIGGAVILAVYFILKARKKSGKANEQSDNAISDAEIQENSANHSDSTKKQ